MYKLLYSLFLFTVLFGNDTVIDSTAPTFYLPTLEGKNFFLSKSLKEGNPIVIIFIIIWCTPWRKKMTILNNIWLLLQDVSIYLINVSGLTCKEKDDTEKVKNMLLSINVDYPVLIDKYAVTA